MTALHITRQKIDTIRPPADIRERTAERRAWLAAKAAELNAPPDTEAKVVGVGTYQEVSVWRVTRTAGRVQQRGTCQACGQRVACTDGPIAKHGYKVRHRGQGGYFVGTCQGSGRAPAEQEIAFARHLLDLYASYIVNCEAELPNAELAAANATRPTVPQPRMEWRGDKQRPIETPENLAHAAAWEQYAWLHGRPSALRNDIWQLTEARRIITKHVLPRHGCALIEAIVA